MLGPAPTLGYNLDTAHPVVLAPDVGPSFGHQVLHFGNDRLVVGAPGDYNTTGHLYQCSVPTNSCEPLLVPGELETPHLGMSLASDGTRLMACSPGLTQVCDRNLYLSGLCYLFNGSSLKDPQEITPGYQQCLKGKVDLVFLFDGSNSMNERQFSLIRSFMVEVMEKLKNSTIHFAAVQFSSEVKTEFDFTQYMQNPNPRELLKNVMHMRWLTDTFKAIKYVADHLFTPEHGAREDAKRVMIIITDGEASDNGDVIAAEKKKITRYIIGVGNNFGNINVTQFLTKFASQPSSEYVKVLDSFEKLSGLFKEIQTKIYTIEGTSDKTSFHLELSSSGFSSHLSQGQTLVGAVGADDWAGGFFDLEGDPGTPSTKETFVASPMHSEDSKDAAYLGYAMAMLRGGGRTVLAAGAPRHGHVGRVTLFQLNPHARRWNPIQDISGKQIGSYFGGALAAVTGQEAEELLLVGAPMYMGRRHGGRVTIYRWAQEQLKEAGQLEGVVGQLLGRFGAALGAVGDLNGDGWTDVAVGAPLEDEGSGAVYIFHGGQHGLHTPHSQRVRAADMDPGLQFLGQALDGGTDLDGDKLPDIAVGARGQVLVLRSRPIVRVLPVMRFQMPEIPVRQVECSGDGGAWKDVVFGVYVCLNVTLDTPQYQDPITANLRYQLEIDADRMKSRGVFANGMKITEGNITVTSDTSCTEQEVRIVNCVDDIITGIRVSLRFLLQEDEGGLDLYPVLNPLIDSSWAEIPFEKNCGEDHICEADLHVRFSSDGPRDLLLSPVAELRLALDMWNHGEDAYQAVLHLRHPPGLSFRRATATQAGSQIRVSCDGVNTRDVPDLRTLQCNVSHPIFWGSSQVLVELLFDAARNSSWEEWLKIEATVSSNNDKNETLHSRVATLLIPILYPINIIAKGLDSSTPYVNFISEERGDQRGDRRVEHVYQVENLLREAWPQPEMMAFVVLPRSLPANLAWKTYSVRRDSNESCELKPENMPFLYNISQDCHVYVCHLGLIHSSVHIYVSGVLEAPLVIKNSSRSHIHTMLFLDFNHSCFRQWNNEFTHTKVQTEVEQVYVMDYLPVYVGSSVGGLVLLILIIIVLYKCGFFKRSYKDRMEEQEPGAKDGHGLGDGDEANGGKEPLEEGDFTTE
ncbi:integrin alpha-L isoform X2 [Alligator mississippiensis]|uniref:integrin alpha-L isoform X2 n=1 Tax=Alligator mississippiensis TaxID=8496 RepID=UPI002877C407|nr:integrin alpha-L isoform X2 [Alligator mississippiensis]